MAILSATATALVALLHAYILYLEMFLWTKPAGRRAFRLAPDFAQQSASLAANMGLYNGFLSAGLVWGLVHPVEEFARQIRVFFLGLVVVAGLFGGATAARKIWYVQMTPGLLALGLVFSGL